MATVYEILQVVPQDDFAVLRKAYLKQAKALHPDRNPNVDETKFKDLQMAWTHIDDEKKAKAYFSWFQNCRNKPDVTVRGADEVFASRSQANKYKQVQIEDAYNWWTFCATKLYANPGNIQSVFSYQHATGFHPGALNLWRIIEKQVNQNSSYIERVLEFKTLYLARINQDNRRNFQFTLVNHNIECDFPASYSRIDAISRASNATDDPLLGVARELLNDYTKGNSSVSRFFHGHWNRHHVEAVAGIVNAIDNKKISNMEDLILILRCVELKNPTHTGSLFRRIAYIEKMYFNQLENSKSAVPEKDLPTGNTLTI